MWDLYLASCEAAFLEHRIVPDAAGQERYPACPLQRAVG
jgi:hypothetical protein